LNVSPKTQVTRTLSALSAGDGRAMGELIPLVYHELRALADIYLRGDRSGHTLQPTALVHEAFLRLVDETAVSRMDRTHFFAIAARVMRRVLVDHARARATDKRGGAFHRVTLHAEVAVTADAEVDLMTLDDALGRLAELDERLCRVVELRFFGRLTIEETASVLGVSKRSVDSDWELARAWLHRELTRDLRPE